MGIHKEWKYFNLMNIPEAESYFRDKAQEGLFLEDISTYRYHFREGDPQEMEYRIEYGKGSLSAEQWQLYRDCGWKYICAEGEYFVFGAEKGTAQELHTDPAEQYLQWQERLKKNQGFLLVSVLLILVVMIQQIPFIGGYDFFPRYHLAESLGLLLLWGLLLLREGRKLLESRRMAARLKNGMPIRHEGDWKKLAQYGRIANGIATVLIVLAFIRLLLV